MVEPAIALGIVYVGADNLMVRGGRDLRAWIAFAFGFIHGLGLAHVLGGIDLPARALGWSLFSFDVGVEIGQLFVVVAVASAWPCCVAAARSRGGGSCSPVPWSSSQPARSGSFNACSFLEAWHETNNCARGVDRCAGSSMTLATYQQKPKWSRSRS